MTIITVTTPQNRLTDALRSELALTLTDAVLLPEVGQPSEAARLGFQVHFVELPDSHMAIGGQLLSAQAQRPDVATIDICAMDGHWPPALRQTVIENVLAAMCQACGMAKASPRWWVNFRVIDEGSWGSRGRVLSILSLLDPRVFSQARIDDIRRALGAG